MTKLYEKDIIEEVRRLESIFLKDDYVRMIGSIKVIRSNTVFKRKIFVNAENGTISETIKVTASDLEDGRLVVQIRYPIEKGVHKTITGLASSIIDEYDLSVRKFTIKSYLEKTYTIRQIMSLYKNYAPVFYKEVEAKLDLLKANNLLFKENLIDYENKYRIANLKTIAGLVLADKYCKQGGTTINCKKA